MEITEIAGTTCTVPVEAGDISFNLTFYPNRVTQNSMNKHLSADNDVSFVEAIASWIVKSVGKGWDVTLNKKPLPFTVESMLDYIPIPLIMNILAAVREGSSPNAEKPKT